MKRILKKINDNILLNPKENKKIREFMNENKKTIFDIERTSDNKYSYSLKNNDLYNEVFRSYIDETLSKRESAALQGNSHLSKCTKGLLLMREDNLNSSGVFFELPNKTFSPNKKIAIIIENLETFINKEFIESLKINNINDCNVIFGSGGVIQNDYFYNFLNQYETVYCLFDWDYYGLSFYKTLFDNNINVIWHCENRFISSFEATNKKDLSRGQVNELINKYKYLPYLEETLETIKKYKSTQEQEIFHTTNKDS
jgi:5S rRNA maturation endonuclease (ribonuclease M5)